MSIQQKTFKIKTSHRKYLVDAGACGRVFSNFSLRKETKKFHSQLGLSKMMSSIFGSIEKGVKDGSVYTAIVYTDFILAV